MDTTKVLALLGVLACVLVWIGPQRLRRAQAALQGAWRQITGRREARRQAAAAIEKALRRSAVERDGNVIRPRAFEPRKDDDRLH